MLTEAFDPHTPPLAIASIPTSVDDARALRFGLLKFGSRADVLIPIGAKHELAVAIGSVVTAGTSVLLRFEDASP